MLYLGIVIVINQIVIVTKHLHSAT